MDIFEIGCLRSMCGLTLWKRVRNEEVGRRAQVEGQWLQRWFGHVERMDEEHMARKVMISDVEGNRCRGIPKLGWMDGTKMALGGRGCQWCKVDRMHWIGEGRS